MIKEKKKRKNKKEEIKKELFGYLRTVFVTFIAGVIITVLLSFHARSEMIKNLSESKEEKSIIERQIAQQIVSKTDFIKSLNGKNYAVCMKVGQLYETAGDYQKAEYAYHLALQKVKDKVYTPYYRLILVYIYQDKIKDAEDLLETITDSNNLSLIRLKTRANIILGDRYYSNNKFLKAAQKYEKANYYYSRLKRQDKVVKKSIEKRLSSSYSEASSVIVKNGYNSDAVRFLNKALRYDPDNNDIKYKLAIIYADLDPVESVKCFEPLIKQMPQNIDYNVYTQALMKAANIEDIQGNGIQAKYYRYKVHSFDLFIKQKVIYKDDIDLYLDSFDISKFLFQYKLKADFILKNNSSENITKMTIEFILRQGDKEKETIILNNFVNRDKPFVSNGGKLDDIKIKMGKNIFTKRELEKYYIDIYIYKDPKYKTLVSTMKIPDKSIKSKNK